MNSGLLFYDHPRLTPFVRHVTANSYLFRQGEPGTTLCIILSGVIDLIAEQNKREYLVNFIDSGQFLGEQAITSDAPYKRAFSAKARTDVKVLEITREEAKKIEKEDPQLMVDLLKGIFHVAANRIQRSNSILRILRSSNNAERLIRLMAFFGLTQGRQTPRGTEISLRREHIRYYIDMNDLEIDDCLDELSRRKLIVGGEGNSFIIPDTTALIKEIPAMAELNPQIPII